MNLVLRTPDRMLLSLTADEHRTICAALNEVCHGIDSEAGELVTRLGIPRASVAALLAQLSAGPKHHSRQTGEWVSAWADGGSVQAVCITASGDPADCSAEEASELRDKLNDAIKLAEKS